MLRYKTETRPGLVALYDIRPGNRAGLFLQPRSPHEAVVLTNHTSRSWWSCEHCCLSACQRPFFQVCLGSWYQNVVILDFIGDKDDRGISDNWSNAVIKCDNMWAFQQT